VQLNQPVRSEQKAEATEVLTAVDEDRKFVYQATIVRLMKARKVGRLGTFWLVSARVSHLGSKHGDCARADALD
jgi:hypothetical protein